MITKQEWDAFCVKRNNETEIGKLILCESKEEGSTRLFIHQFDSWVSALHKDGWWDTFTVTDIPCQKGFYICEIKKFRIDRNGYMNVIVFPKKYLGEVVDEDSPAWNYFFQTGRFSSPYKTNKCCNHFNVERLEEIFKDDIENARKEDTKKYGDDCIWKGRTRQEVIMDKFMSGQATMDEIADALNTLTDMEKISEDIYRHPTKYEAEFPLLIKKIPNDAMFHFPTPESIERFLIHKSLEYDKLGFGDETDILKRTECVLQYWKTFYKAKREEEKAKRKEARKARKAAEKKIKKAMQAFFIFRKINHSITEIETTRF